jgi:gliding motility-associated-like protein
MITFVSTTNAQFTPIPVTGFSQDVVAESGPSSMATTTMEMDSPGSNKIMYSTSFATFAGITAGLPANGTLVSGGDTYQLAGYNGNNALFIYKNQTADLVLVTPASYARLRVVGISTEGPSTINISVTFTDGSTSNYISNYTLPDWFFGSANIIIQGFGRCSRTATGPWTPDGLPSNPKIYYIDVPLNCTDISKQVQKITCSNISSSGNAPFPNTILFGLSGSPYFRNVTDVITPADCAGNNGSISLSVNGSGAPYSFTWNTTPVQTGPVATGLSPGTYTCVITDAAGCTSTYTGTVPLNNNATINATANPVSICPGTPVTLTASAQNLTSFTWNPGNLSGASVTVNPVSTTTYTVTGSNTVGCNGTAQVTVTVNPVPPAPVITGTGVPGVCIGSTEQLNISNPQAGYLYNWYNVPAGGSPVGIGTFFITPPITANVTFYVEAVNSSGCISSRVAYTVIMIPLPAAPSVSNINICSGNNAVFTVNNPQPASSYFWYSVPSGGTSLSTGTSYTINNVTTTTVVYVETVVPGGCASATRTQATANILQPLPAPVVTVTSTTQSSLVFSWAPVPGATGYEVTLNGGASFQPPSSGSNGTTHTISGLAMNTTITFQVRALGGQVCETSLLSVAVKGTTLSTKEIFVPNVFTPNGDGKNDVLLVYGNYVASMQLRIFNQWGQLVFYSDNISQGWDGRYKGQQQPIGVYAYSLKVVLNDNTVINKKGSINLVR